MGNVNILQRRRDVKHTLPQYDMPHHRGRAGGTKFGQDNMQGSRGPRGNPGVVDVQATLRQTQTRQLRERGEHLGHWFRKQGVENGRKER